VRMLQPTGELEDDDLEAAYAYPAERTWSRLNVVSSLDGAAAGHDGRSRGLSSPGDQRVFTLLRSLADVILVGAGTARAEAYAPVRAHEVHGDVRDRLGLAPLPPLAVVSQRLDLPDLLLEPTGPDGARTLVVTSAAAPPERLADLGRRGVDVLVCGDRAVDHRAARDRLADRGLRRILCEGGPRLAGTLAGTDALDEVCLTLSPQLVAGGAGRVGVGAGLDPPLRLRLGHALADGEVLLLRYVRDDHRSERGHRHEGGG